MRIGIHQPNFLPWMGYFHKIALSDTFVFLDHVQYTKKSFTKRVKIHKPNNILSDQYITVPLKKHSDFASINSLQIATGNHWQHKISTQIYESYHKAPYYYQIEPLISIFFTQPLKDNNFSTFNIEIIKYISNLLGIAPNWVVSSELKIPYSGPDVNIDILKFLNGTTYLSGMGAKKYQDENQFKELNVDLEYSDYSSKFEGLFFPEHFLQKSIVSYLTHYDIEILKQVVQSSIL